MSINIEKFFPSTEFENSRVQISIFDKKKEHCVDVIIKYNDNELFVDQLTKCGKSSGADLLKRVELFAQSLPSTITKITLNDASRISLCSNYLICSLTNLSILTTGESWYNKLGYRSEYNYAKEKEHNEQSIMQSVENAFKQIFRNDNDLATSAVNSIARILNKPPIEVERSLVKEIFQELKNVLLHDKEICSSMFDDVATVIDTINMSNIMLEYDTYLTKPIQREQILGGKRLKTKAKKRTKSKRKTRKIIF
jgi:hypothetical protein